MKFLISVFIYVFLLQLALYIYFFLFLREALMVVEDIKSIINDLMECEQFPPISVELIDNELGVIYSNSIKGEVSLILFI